MKPKYVSICTVLVLASALLAGYVCATPVLRCAIAHRALVADYVAGCYYYHWRPSCATLVDCEHSYIGIWSEGTGANECSCVQDPNGYWDLCIPVPSDFTCHRLWKLEPDCDHLVFFANLKGLECFSYGQQ